ncbi:hypothetical protein FOXB_05129 [Fusarium oxysporum f. sp. conglutinans Fo5176]|uniref:Uncharacterized protein n=1 Tax=Fusarium oxysporum (strain Fo5176) TaxID=660025 RepID=F9FFF0_FUSOF|nr:hypothetical protein FOXB_05129 [Fusarium oxysporum f. sp. conglutinans Fo5176]
MVTEPKHTRPPRLGKQAGLSRKILDASHHPKAKAAKLNSLDTAISLRIVSSETGWRASNPSIRRPREARAVNGNAMCTYPQPGDTADIK